MDNIIVSYAIKIIGAIVVIIVLLLISKIIAGIVKRRIINGDTENKHIEKVWKLMHDITFYLLMVFSFFVGFEMMGFNVGLILWGISFGVGLACKEILGNMIAGIMMLYTKEFKMGDIVEINADQVYFGKIEEISIRYTTIRTMDLRQVVIPNMTLISCPIKTFSSEAIIKISAIFGVDYASDTNKVIQVIKTCINTFPFVKETESTKVFLSNFGDSAMEFKALFSFDPNCGILQEIAIGEINEKMNTAFAENDIQVPFTTFSINIDPESKKKLGA